MKPRFVLVLSIAMCLLAPACEVAVDEFGVLVAPDVATAAHDHARRVTVPSSIDPTGESDVWAAFQAFIDDTPDDTAIAFPAGARYRMEQTLLLSRRSQLSFEGNGATIFATTTGTLNRSNIHVTDSADIAFTDLTVVGANPNGGPSDIPYDASLEGQHGFRVRSTAGVTFTRVTVTDTYGDFIYLSKNEENPWTSDVVVRDSRFARSGRAGMSITAAQRVLIEGNRFDDVRRSAFNLEAHHPNFAAAQVTIRDNDIGNVRLNTVAAYGTAMVDDFTFHDNRVEAGIRIWMHSKDGTMQHRWRITDNVGSGVVGNPSLAVMRFSHIEGLVVRGNSQAVQTFRPMVGTRAENSCNVSFDGNDYPGAVGQGTLVGTCEDQVFGSWSTFVTRQFLDLTATPPSEAERSSWAEDLASSAKTTGDLVEALRRSTDNTSKVDPMVRLYRAFLGRPPDAGGLEFWIGRRRTGTWTLVRVADSFAGSSEFQRTYGTLTNREFVTRIYTDVLGRTADTGGVDYWTRTLDTRSRTRGSVMVGFSESSEYKRKQAVATDVAVTYIFLLGRAPTPAETLDWIVRQQAGASVSQLAQELLNQPEYATHANS